MKKTRSLALVLVVAIMLMGAGYAYWSDQLVINNTISTGELNVEFVEQNAKIWPPQFPFPRIKVLTGSDYASATIRPMGPKKIEVTVDNMYPGTWVVYDAKFENKGTIPAVIDNVEIKFTKTSDALSGKLIVFGGYVHHKKNGIPKGGGVFRCTLGEFKTTFNNLLKDIRLEKGEFVTFDIPEDKRDELNQLIASYGIELPDDENCINFLLPRTVVNEDGAEGQTVKFDIELNFTQHNTP